MPPNAKIQILFVFFMLYLQGTRENIAEIEGKIIKNEGCLCLFETLGLSSMSKNG